MSTIRPFSRLCGRSVAGLRSFKASLGRRARADKVPVVMIIWSRKFPKWKYPVGYMRLQAARRRFLDRAGFAIKFRGIPFIERKLGDSDRLSSLKDKHKGESAFIIGNGPSLKHTDMKHLEGQLTIGVNGVYKSFPDWGFHTNYLLFEDVEQTERHGPNIPKIKGPTKIAAIHNAHGIPRPWPNDLLFMNARIGEERYWNDIGIQFSEDFGHIVYLGSSIIYVAMQLAFYLGCDPVYLVGVDFDYGDFAQGNPSGKVEVTPENLSKIRSLHHIPDYHRVGDLVGVPNYDLQEKAYKIARDRFEMHGRSILNATKGGRLNVFDRVDYDRLFEDETVVAMKKLYS